MIQYFCKFDSTNDTAVQYRFHVVNDICTGINVTKTRLKADSIGIYHVDGDHEDKTITSKEYHDFLSDIKGKGWLYKNVPCHNWSLF